MKNPTSCQSPALELEERVAVLDANLKHLGGVWDRRLRGLRGLPQATARRLVRELDVVVLDGGHSLLLDLGDHDPSHYVVPTFTFLQWTKDEGMALADQLHLSRAELFRHLVHRHQRERKEIRRQSEEGK